MPYYTDFLSVFGLDKWRHLLDILLNLQPGFFFYPSYRQNTSPESPGCFYWPGSQSTHVHQSQRPIKKWKIHTFKLKQSYFKVACCIPVNYISLSTQ